MTLPGNRLVLDLGCAVVLGGVALLVAVGGPAFSMLLFLGVPLIAAVQTGVRRLAWLALAASACAVETALLSLSAGVTALRISLLAVSALLAVAAVRAIAYERTLRREASHRIKNDLQLAADFLLLGGTTEETASRIRAIADVHRLLSEGGERVDADSLLHAITRGMPVPVQIETDDATFDSATARNLGVVANELVTNAILHGTPPIHVQLSDGRLQVDSDGESIIPREGLGLEIVRRVVEQGLRGRFELRSRRGGGTHAEVVFPR